MPKSLICAHCGTPFESTHLGRGRYCSTDCYHAAGRRGKTLTCETCGSTFYRRPTRAYQRFCSSACRIADAKIEKTCERCGSKFIVNASIAHRYQRCSLSCSPRLPMIPCERCGKLFRGEGRGRIRRYCSDACRYPPNSIICRQCGSEKHVCPSELHRQFCSLACYRRSRGPTKPEIEAEKILAGMGLQFEREARIGRFSVDFLLPKIHVALEIDGAYWHRNKARDNRKTSFLESQGVVVVRIDAESLDEIRTVLQPVHSNNGSAYAGAQKDDLLDTVVHPLVHTDHM